MADENTPVQQTKSPFFSKTIMINAIMGICMALSAFVPAMGGIAEFIKNNAILLGSLWSVLAVILRFVSKDKIVLTD